MRRFWLSQDCSDPWIRYYAQWVERTILLSRLKIVVHREEVILEAAINRSQHFGLESLQLPASFDLEKLGVQLNHATAWKSFWMLKTFLTVQYGKLRIYLAKKTGWCKVFFLRLYTSSLCVCVNRSQMRHLSAYFRRSDAWKHGIETPSRKAGLRILPLCQPNMLKTLDRKKIMCDFIDRTAERRSVFGTF